jgi:hypothetical protein
LAFLDAEIASALESLDKAKQKLDVLYELRNDYLARPTHFAPQDGTRLTSTQELATRAIASFLKDRTEPVPTTALLEHLKRQGIQFGGRQPRNTLSVLLSRSKDFVAHGRRGWTMATE